MKQLAEELYEYAKVVGSHNKHIQKVAKDLVDRLNEPILNDNQQEVSDWLQAYADKDCGDKPFQTIFYLWDCIRSDRLGRAELSALRKLTREQQFQVLAAFAQWGLEQEARK